MIHNRVENLNTLILTTKMTFPNYHPRSIMVFYIINIFGITRPGNLLQHEPLSTIIGIVRGKGVGKSIGPTPLVVRRRGARLVAVGYTVVGLVYSTTPHLWFY